MKTTFLSLILIAVCLGLSTTSFAKTIEYEHVVEQLQNGDNGSETDDPVSYTARIKRFRHQPKGLDYFDPTYTNTISYTPRLSPMANIQKVTPYDFINFQAWVKIQNDPVIWRYNNDENYRELVNNWNRSNNPFWTFAIYANCPFGTFDFTAGLGKANEVIVYDYAIGRAYGFYTDAYKIGLSNMLGQPFTGKAQPAETNKRPIGVVQLPIRDIKQTTVNHQTIEKPNFTKHIPTNLSWDKYEGLRNGASVKHLSVSEKWERRKKSGTSQYNASFSNQHNHSHSSNQRYNDLATNRKHNNFSSSNINRSSSQPAASRTPTKAAKTTSSNN